MQARLQSDVCSWRSDKYPVGSAECGKSNDPERVIEFAPVLCGEVFVVHGYDVRAAEHQCKEHSHHEPGLAERSRNKEND